METLGCHSNTVFGAFVTSPKFPSSALTSTLDFWTNGLTGTLGGPWRRSGAPSSTPGSTNPPYFSSSTSSSSNFLRFIVLICKAQCWMGSRGEAQREIFHLVTHSPSGLKWKWMEKKILIAREEGPLGAQEFPHSAEASKASHGSLALLKGKGTRGQGTGGWRPLQGGAWGQEAAGGGEGTEWQGRSALSL